jgi:hypothetical protein
MEQQLRTIREQREAIKQQKTTIERQERTIKGQQEGLAILLEQGESYAAVLRELQTLQSCFGHVVILDVPSVLLHQIICSSAFILVQSITSLTQSIRP